uniref:uncharacterized protein LOC101487717 isoform X2 n=1 Tax=Maylandia zebra TaxID=106582 RepID=UPI000D31A54E|nr:uncharacterized protein LOC101487717 isoform X2 [Maylandia zebra]
MKILPGSCSSAVTFKSQLNQKSKIYESLKCNVTDESSNKVKLFPFSSQSSGNMEMDGQNNTEPEDDISLASISYTKNTREEGTL